MCEQILKDNSNSLNRKKNPDIAVRLLKKHGEIIGSNFVQKQSINCSTRSMLEVIKAKDEAIESLYRKIYQVQSLILFLPPSIQNYGAG